MQILFANTGVQVLCIPLRGGARFQTSQIGYGWQRTRCSELTQEGEEIVRNYPYIQWQIIQSSVTKLFLAVDTTCGEQELGYFCAANNLTHDFEVMLEGFLDVQGRALKGIQAIEFAIRAAATSGNAKHVHLIVDFGNSRTGALLLEMSGEISQTPQMLPFELINRYHLDCWNDEGQFVSRHAARWFSSKTHWCSTPYLDPEEMKKIEYHAVERTEETAPTKKKGLFGGGKKAAAKNVVIQNKVELAVVPPLFDDVSMVRMGKEVDDVMQIMRPLGDIRTGVSSPKRYLWADDETWLEGANWYMADPSDRCQTGVFAASLQGGLLKYIHEDDNDFLISGRKIQDKDYAVNVPLKPRHAPRTLMSAAVYEMLCQAYSYVNSPPYRNSSGDSGRAREIRSVSMTFPSGMIQEERERLFAQANKALKIFTLTIGKNQRVEPELNLSIDEASAVHLTYIWAELRLLGQDPRIWFKTFHQDRGEVKVIEEEEEYDPLAASPASRRRGGVDRPGGRPGRPGAARGKKEDEEFGTDNSEVRIACIDIGGGTTDLMIAKYNFESKIDDQIRGEVIHQDGISLGGDQLVKRLLETIIIPAFADSIGIENEDIKLLFGPEVPKNRALRHQRVNWMNRLFVQLAQQYLQHASLNITDEPVTHTDPEVVDTAIVDSLQETLDKLHGPGYYSVETELNLYYNKGEFEGVVYDVFDGLLFDYCQRLSEHKTDVVLLAGQPSKIEYIQELVQMYIPLPPSRIVPMYNHYAGNWYPYQDEKGHNPGVIIDPKSPVVVGAAIEFLARNGMLPQFKFAMKPRIYENSYFWGVMTDSTSGIRPERILFQPAEEMAREEITEFQTSSQRVLIGRKLSANDDSQASPVYLLRIDVGDLIGETNINVRIKRVPASENTEEHLEIESVAGIVAGTDAVLEENVFFVWRTLADERYYLDTGGLDNIEVDGAY